MSEQEFLLIDWFAWSPSHRPLGPPEVALGWENALGRSVSIKGTDLYRSVRTILTVNAWKSWKSKKLELIKSQIN